MISSDRRPLRRRMENRGLHRRIQDQNQSRLIIVCRATILITLKNIFAKILLNISVFYRNVTRYIKRTSLRFIIKYIGKSLHYYPLVVIRCHLRYQAIRHRFLR
jgi:hypothetical protein